MDCTSNRVRFSALNTSQRNCKLCVSFHGIFQRFASPRSKPAKPSPRSVLRAPTCPGKSAWKLASAAAAAAAFPNTLTVPSGFLDAPTVCTGAISVAAPDSCQFVGHCAPLDTLNGKPLVQRARPVSCHPPMTPSAKPWALPPNRLPWPKGSSHTQLAFTWRGVSKSDTPRVAVGFQGLMIWLPSPPSALIRLASEEMSIDFEYV